MIAVSKSFITTSGICCSFQCSFKSKSYSSPRPLPALGGVPVQIRVYKNVIKQAWAGLLVGWMAGQVSAWPSPGSGMHRKKYNFAFLFSEPSTS